MMEEELNYVTATFQRNGAAAHEKEEESVVIYEQVNVVYENTITENPPEQRGASAAGGGGGGGGAGGAGGGADGGGLRRLLCVLAAALGLVCIILTSVIITLSSHFAATRSEQEGEVEKLSAQLQRQTEELRRDKERLNWTLGVILQSDVFNVQERCPQKVCSPCPDGWRRFRSSCYLFDQSIYYNYWRTWEGSRRKCKEFLADLVVIDSLEEQEFLRNHTKFYNDAAHGYWIGLRIRNTDRNTWRWIDGSNVTLEYWKTENPGYIISCALTLPQESVLTNWNKASCDMKNRWICETKALFKFD